MAPTGNAVSAIELLVAAGADINAKASSGQTALYWAAVEGGADAVRKLVELGADVNGAPDIEPVFSSIPLGDAIARGRCRRLVWYFCSAGRSWFSNAS
ncbi:MAG: ankyrin repeat domain-containing protein [Alphaproteobacteria bacterium]